MKKYSDLLTIEDRVTQILEENPQARKSDYILAAKLIEQLAFEGGQSGKIKPTDRAKMYEIAQALYLYNTLPIPSLKSIDRSRRKAQERRPALKDEKIGILRKQQEDAFVNYSHT